MNKKVRYNTFKIDRICLKEKILYRIMYLHEHAQCNDVGNVCNNCKLKIDQ